MAIKEIQRAAKVNGRQVSKELLEKVMEAFGARSRGAENDAHSKTLPQIEVETASKRGTMLDIFRIPYLRKRAIIMSYVW